ncbi:MAG: HNH endonuclease [Candidatus Gracilibacteria bacterium]|nr:HNH endonuclease [Candidatus Gracilibacteria bacterium]
MTKVEAIIKVMQDNGGIANWKILYNELEKYYPEIKKSNEWQAGIRGVLYREIKNGKNFKKIDEGIFSLFDYDENNLLLDEDGSDIVTQGKSFIKTRIKQSQLRTKIIRDLKICPFTQINDDRLLIASHIKPWAFSNNRERLDLNNVFIFSPLFDKLFDRGLISFGENKSLLVSRGLSEYNRKRIGIFEGQIINLLPINGRENYLHFHREKVFLD